MFTVSFYFILITYGSAKKPDDNKKVKKISAGLS